MALWVRVVDIHCVDFILESCVIVSNRGNLTLNPEPDQNCLIAMTQHMSSRNMLVDHLPFAISKLFRSNQELKRSTGRPPIAGLLIDISGNLHVGPTPTPNAVEAFQKLQKSSLKYRLCSNSSKESTKSLINRLREMGFDVVPGGDTVTSPAGQLVWTSLGAVAQLVEDQNLKRFVVFDY